MFIKPYGDTLDDGAVQLSFTLPVTCGGRAKEGARQYVLKLGFKHAEIVHAHPLSPEFTFFVAYAKTDTALDYSKVEYAEAVDKSMTMAQVDKYIEDHFKRKLVILGACTGTDAHTVGIDAIMNMKGYDHHYGLERYTMIDAYNLGSQVPNEKLLEQARKLKADAVLISQIVTQKDVHIHNLTNLIELAEAEKLRDKLVMVIGGPRVNNKLAKELGYDAGFGPGTFAEDVATFVVKKLARTLLKK